MADQLAAVRPELRHDEFVDEVVVRLTDLGLKARIAWIATCLARHLPGDYRQAVRVVLRSLPPP